MDKWLVKNRIYFETLAAALLSFMAVVVTIVQVRDSRQTAAEQSALLQTQNRILESTRRMGYRDQLESILAAVDRSIEEQADGSPPWRLPERLQLRILAYSRVTRPYHVPSGDGRNASARLLSSERGELLTYLTLAKTDLQGIWGAHAPEFAYADLWGQVLSKANLTSCNFGGADLSHADLQDAILLGCNLRDATLRYANLEGADLRSANVDGADFVGAYLDHCIVGEDWLNATAALSRPARLNRSHWTCTKVGDKFRLQCREGITREKHYPVVDRRLKQAIPFDTQATRRAQ